MLTERKQLIVVSILIVKLKEPDPALNAKLMSAWVFVQSSIHAAYFTLPFAIRRGIFRNVSDHLSASAFFIDDEDEIVPGKVTKRVKHQIPS